MSVDYIKLPIKTAKRLYYLCVGPSYLLNELLVLHDTPFNSDNNPISELKRLIIEAEKEEGLEK